MNASASACTEAEMCPNLGSCAAAVQLESLLKPLCRLARRMQTQMSMPRTQKSFHRSWIPFYGLPAFTNMHKLCTNVHHGLYCTTFFETVALTRFTADTANCNAGSTIVEVTEQKQHAKQTSIRYRLHVVVTLQRYNTDMTGLPIMFPGKNTLKAGQKHSRAVVRNMWQRGYHLASSAAVTYWRSFNAAAALLQ